MFRHATCVEPSLLNPSQDSSIPERNANLTAEQREPDSIVCSNSPKFLRNCCSDIPLRGASWGFSAALSVFLSEGCIDPGCGI